MLITILFRFFFILLKYSFIYSNMFSDLLVSSFFEVTSVTNLMDQPHLSSMQIILCFINLSVPAVHSTATVFLLGFLFCLLWVSPPAVLMYLSYKQILKPFISYFMDFIKDFLENAELHKCALFFYGVPFESVLSIISI